MVGRLGGSWRVTVGGGGEDEDCGSGMVGVREDVDEVVGVEMEGNAAGVTVFDVKLG